VNYAFGVLQVAAHAVGVHTGIYIELHGDNLWKNRSLEQSSPLGARVYTLQIEMML
jgi:hypothetical protein